MQLKWHCVNTSNYTATHINTNARQFFFRNNYLVDLRFHQNRIQNLLDRLQRFSPLTLSGTGVFLIILLNKSSGVQRTRRQQRTATTVLTSDMTTQRNLLVVSHTTPFSFHHQLHHHHHRPFLLYIHFLSHSLPLQFIRIACEDSTFHSSHSYSCSTRSYCHFMMTMMIVDPQTKTQLHCI